MNTKALISTKEITHGGIPCTHITPDFLDEPYGTVFLYHGWSNDTYKKEGFLYFASLLAYHGYQVFVPELINHGERGHLDYWNASVMREHFWRTCIQTIKEFDILSKEVFSTYHVNAGKIALAGHSLGGCIASSLYASNEEIKCLITMNSSGALEDLDRTYFSKLRKAGNSSEFLTLEEYSELKKYDPSNKLEFLKQRPILLLHGDCDTTVPIAAQKYFYDKLLPLYKNSPERLKFVEIENVNHTITLDMIKNTTQWLDTYLK